MERNPYQALAAIFGGDQQGVPPFRIGQVTSLTPLTVSVAGVKVSGEIWVNADLLPGAGRKVSLRGQVTISSTYSNVSGELSGSGLSLTAESAGIKAGDEVLLMSCDDQTFILICKVVKL